MRHRPGYLPPLGGHHDNQRRGQPWTAQSSKTSASPARLGNFGDQIPGASRDRAHQFAGHPTDTDRGRRPDRPAARPSDLVQSRTVTPTDAPHHVALVLGGGGAAGNAWAIGVIAGLAEAGLDMSEAADGVVGTSSGAIAAAQVSSGIPPADLVASVLSPRVQFARTEPRTTAGPAGGNGVRANESHLRRRQLRSRCSTCDGRIRIGVRLDTRSHDRTAPRRGCRQVASS